MQITIQFNILQEGDIQIIVNGNKSIDIDAMYSMKLLIFFYNINFKNLFYKNDLINKINPEIYQKKDPALKIDYCQNYYLNILYR